MSNTRPKEHLDIHSAPAASNIQVGRSSACYASSSCLLDRINKSTEHCTGGYLPEHIDGRFIKGIVEAERSRIARELHDHLNQKMALLSIELDRLSQSCPDQEIRAGLERAMLKSKEISIDIYHISRQLHSRTNRGLVDSVNRFCQEFSQQTALKIEFSYDDVPEPVPREVAHCLLRIIQESIENVRKHSGTNAAMVFLAGLAGAIALRVWDNGVGFDLHSYKQGLGLFSMRERVGMLGGSFEINSRPSFGTEIRVEVPLINKHFTG